MKLRVAIALLGTVVACNGDGVLRPPFGFEHSAAAATCGPADGPATTILLSHVPVSSMQPEGLHARIWIWRGVSELAGHTWTLAGSDMQGWASLHSGTDQLDEAISGAIAIVSVSADNTITGNVDVTFSQRGRIRGGFSARWIPTRAFAPCG